MTYTAFLSMNYDPFFLTHISSFRIHTDERPFKCRLCPYRSRDSSQLTVHLRTHTNDRPFVCNYETCGSAFKTNSDLKRHLKLHTCPHCPFKSASQMAVKTHINEMHMLVICQCFKHPKLFSAD